MTDHYYSVNPTTSSNPAYWQTHIKGIPFQFKTDRGVFSKDDVDFGSRVLIETFENPPISGPILDVGCGWGAIGLALAKLFPEKTVHMVDINERALDLAKENAERNKIKNVHIYKSNAFENIQNTEFSAIVTNPPIRAGKSVVYSIFENSVAHLQQQGELWVVIQKKQGAPSAKKKLEELFGNVKIVKREKGYYILKAIKI